MNADVESVLEEEAVAAAESADPANDLLAKVRDFHPAGDFAQLARAIHGCKTYAAKPDLALERGMIVAQARLDTTTVCAAVLLDCDSLAEPARHELQQPSEVWSIIEATNRLRAIKWDQLTRESSENLRRMFVALAADVRVLVMTLADRVCLVRRLDGESEAARKAIAQETMDVYAPLANRIGIWQIKWQLEDLSLKALEPQIYRELKMLLNETRSSRTAYVNDVIALLQAKLKAENIPAQINGRPKHIYSIYKKMQRKHVGFDQIYDVVAVRVLVEKVSDCYAVLGLVHGLWTPISGEFDDYIARPKNNMYQSLHTAVSGPNGNSLEIQVRTHAMHDFAEYGVAAHWAYKEGGRFSRGDRAAQEQFDLLHELLDWQRHLDDPETFAEGLKTELFREHIYVFTPKGDVIDLPRGATVLDFAYRIHTMIGHRCRGARIDGKIVTLQTQLQTGNRVDILTRKNPEPSRDWLSPQNGYLATASARTKVRQWFREQGRDAAQSAGAQIFEKTLEKLNIKEAVSDELAAAYGFRSMDEVYAALGFGELSSHRLQTVLLEREAAQKAAVVVPTPSPRQAKPQGERKASGVRLSGVDDVLSQPARCCTPVPGDPVIGYISKGRGITLHRRDCPNVPGLPEPERIFDIEWGEHKGRHYPVRLRIVAKRSPLLLKHITELVAGNGAVARSIDTEEIADSRYALTLTVEIPSAEVLSRLMNRLEHGQGIESVVRIGT
jgi:GTP pyrophosphokinase